LYDEEKPTKKMQPVYKIQLQQRLLKRSKRPSIIEVIYLAEGGSPSSG
jgi:hypothetical protein